MLNERVARDSSSDEVFHQRVSPYERDFQADKVIDVQGNMVDKSCEQEFKNREKIRKYCHYQKKFGSVENADSQIGDRVEMFVNILPEVAKHSRNIIPAGSEAVKNLMIKVD